MPRVSLFSLSVILSSLLLFSGAMLVWLWIARRKRDTEMRTHGKPALIIPMSSSPDVPRIRLVHEPMPRRRTPGTALAIAQPLSPSDYEVSVGVATDSVATMTTGPNAIGDAVAEVIHGHSLRFHQPVDQSLRYLPGHLQVIEGVDAGVAVRFVRLSEQEASVITFGRSEGPPYRHVQLLEPTVSRTHARMVFDEDAWFLTSLSRTNPVSVNRIPMVDENAVRLAEGDRIEMGALVFRFHSR